MSVGSAGSATGSITDTLGQATAAAEDNLRSLAQTMDPNSTSDLIQYQAALQKWNLNASMESNTMKTIGDVMKSVVQR